MTTPTRDLEALEGTDDYDPAARCVCHPGDMIPMCLGVPGESDACGACLELDPETPCLADVDPDADRDDVLEDDTLEDDSHVEREPWTLRLRARVQREWALWSCLGWSAHHLCTHRTALASGGDPRV